MDELISFFKIKRNLINLLTLGIMILGLPIGIKLAKEQQIFTARARNAEIQFLTKEVSGQPESCVTNKGGTLVTTCDTVSVRIVAPAVLTKKGPELVKKAYAAACASISDSEPPNDGWQLIEAAQCDPNNPGNKGQYWVCFDDNGVPAKERYVYDTPDSSCGAVPGAPAPAAPAPAAPAPVSPANVPASGSSDCAIKISDGARKVSTLSVNPGDTIQAGAYKKSEDAYGFRDITMKVVKGGTTVKPKLGYEEYYRITEPGAYTLSANEDSCDTAALTVGSAGTQAPPANSAIGASTGCAAFFKEGNNWTDNQTINFGDTVTVAARKTDDKSYGYRDAILTLTRSDGTVEKGDLGFEAMYRPQKADTYKLSASGGSCNSGSGKATLNVRSSGANSPGSGAITHYKIAENFTALEQAEKKPYNEGVSGGVITLFTFTDKTPGAKTVLVAFLDSKGRQSTPPLPKSITLVPQPPVITSFDAPFDMGKARINLKITGDNFGSAQGKIKVNGSELSSDKIDNWNGNFGGKQRVLAHIDNVTSSQNLSVVLVRSDGEQSAPATYQVNVTQLSLGAKLFGRAQRDFDQDNVTLSIFEMVGVGTSAAPVGIGSTAPSFRVVSTAKEKVVIDKEGTISNIKTRLKEGADYIACILAPLSVRVCTPQFTAVPGNNIIQDFRLPMGDVNNDGCINASDASICKSEWGLISSSSNKRCNFNRDNRVNVYEWSILLWSYNKCNAEEPKQQ